MKTFKLEPRQTDPSQIFSLMLYPIIYYITFITCNAVELNQICDVGKFSESLLQGFNVVILSHKLIQKISTVVSYVVILCISSEEPKTATNVFSILGSL